VIVSNGNMNKIVVSVDSSNSEQSVDRVAKYNGDGLSHALPGLSAILRISTMTAHHRVEQKMRLPASITSLIDYENCLARFLAFYRPFDVLLMRFDDWASTGLDAPNGTASARLAADLEVLGARRHDVIDAPRAYLPFLPDFAHALGALYVIEGSALGSRFILAELRSVLGEGLAGADAFLSGRGEAGAGFWGKFRTHLDRYGMDHPEQTGRVVAGANAIFEATGTWMQT
jgi:heme oxygenase (biliverdin-IX-beta and delta-forming)